MLNPVEELMQSEVPCSFHLLLVQFFITSQNIFSPSDNFGTPLSLGISAIHNANDNIDALKKFSQMLCLWECNGLCPMGLFIFTAHVFSSC
jgi:hypothetical protein